MAPHLVWQDFHTRYSRPLVLAETGIEDDRRAEWFSYISDETKAAKGLKIPLEGLCLYPIVNHPGWEDSRHCHNGLWDYADENGERQIYEPLAAAIREFTA